MTALREASHLGDLRAILRVKFGCPLALGVWPREDLTGAILSLKKEEPDLLDGRERHRYPWAA